MIPGKPVELFDVPTAVVETPGVAASVFSLIHRYVRGDDEVFRIIGMVREEGNADTDGDANSLVVKVKGDAGETANDPLGKGTCLVGVAKMGDEKGKFVTAEASDDLVFAGEGSEFARNSDQKGVAGAMAEGVVEVLEFVEVKEEKRCKLLIALRFRKGCFEQLFEPPPVVKTGESVAFGKVDKLLGVAPLEGDVLKEPEPTDEALVKVADGITELQENATVGEVQFGGIGDFMGARYREEKTREVFRFGKLGLAGLHRFAGEGADEKVVGGNSPEAAQRGVGVENAVVGADEKDAETHRFEQGGEVRVLLFEGIEGLLCFAFGSGEGGHFSGEGVGHGVESASQPLNFVMVAGRRTRVEATRSKRRGGFFDCGEAVSNPAKEE
ncbi:MAG: hypothetical protein N2557_04775 [Hydrogenophilus sp.]|nr:hypothetical protein [Hydrogenophilus sp.]